MTAFIRTLLFALLLAALPARAAIVGVVETESSANLSIAPFTTTVTVPAITIAGIPDASLAFLNSLTFRLEAPGTVMLRASATNVDDLTLKLLLPTPIAIFADDDSLMASTLLGAGTYVAELSGDILPGAPGRYTFEAFIAAIPEPHTWMLMLAGLVAFGAVAVRRS